MVFVYVSRSCSGNEKQVFARENRVDVPSFSSVKVFCHEARTDLGKRV